MRSLVTISILGASIINSTTGLIPQVSVENIQTATIAANQNTVIDISDNYNFDKIQGFDTIGNEFKEYKADELVKFQKQQEEEKRINDEQEARRKQEETDRNARIASQKQQAEEAAARQVKVAATPAPVPAPTISIPSGGIKSDAYNYVKSLGYDDTQWAAVDYIITRESTWNPNSINPSSGACGLAQANPCTTAKFGKYPDYKSNWQSQINWFLDYVNARYGSPSKAYEFWIKNYWY